MLKDTLLNKVLFAIIITSVAIFLITMIVKELAPDKKTIDFEACVKAGGMISEQEYPRICYLGGSGERFTEKINNSTESIQIKNNIQLLYNVSGCEKQKNEDIKTRNIENSIILVGQFINLTYSFNSTCCAKMKVYLDDVVVESPPNSSKIDYTLIKLKIKNEGGRCRCICDYKINAELGPLGRWEEFEDAGNYRIQIWGIEFEDQKPEFLWEKNISANKEIEPIKLPNPASIYCTQQGGKLRIEKDKWENEYGVCVFANGTVCEEWEFFKNNECKNYSN